ncbi:MAG: tetratricopeptide repeat protein [Anaerolineaceae bacterium]
MAATNFYDFLNGLLSDDEKVLVLPAFRQDPFIFKELQAPESVANLIEARESIQTRLVPGAFTLAAVHPTMVDAVIKGERLPSETLEKVMTTYENHKQNCGRPESLETAVDLAVALIEKRKIVSHWKLVLNDVFKGRTTGGENVSADCWNSAIMIASQLDSHNEEIFEGLSATSGSKTQHSIFIHCVMAQPLPVEEKIARLTEAFANHPESDQVQALGLILQKAGKAVAEGTAKALLASRTGIPSREVSTSTVWSNPADQLSLAARYQNLGMIAQIAQENEKALAYVEAAYAIAGRFRTGLGVQKIGVHAAIGQKDQQIEEALEIHRQNPGDEEILSELMAAIEPFEDTAFIGTIETGEDPIFDFARAKSIEAAGNLALAHEAATKTYQSVIKNPHAATPRFSPNFNLEKVFDLLAHYDLPSEAVSIARKLLEQNASDINMVKKSAPLFFEAGEYGEALDLYSTLEFLNPTEVEIKRKKALIFEKTGQDLLALDSWKSIRELSPETEDGDLLHLANTANRLNDADTAIEAASAILEGSSFYNKALVALGKSYRLKGNSHQAIQCLAKAIELEVDDEEPWLALADQYSQTGESERSVDTLKAARSVFPESKEIPYELAKQLVEKNSPSEALSLLVELTERNPEYMPGQLLTVQTMKALHHEGVDAKIDELAIRFPDSAEISFLKGQQYLKNGFRPEARTVLAKAAGGDMPHPEWLAAYADALAGEDYQRVHFITSAAATDLHEAQKVLQRSGIVYTDPLAASVNAEILLASGKADEAFKSISELEAKQVSPDSEWYWRLQAGMARAALLLGKFDVALASIQDAINQKPGLAGLQQILANVHQASGDTLAAIEAANQVLMIAPDVVENVLWFARFLSGLGRQDEAEKELQKAISRKPEEIKYKLALADLLVQADRETELMQTLGNVESLKQANLDEADLVHAAELYLKMGDLKSTAAILKQRLDGNSDSVQAKLDLAGILFRNDQFDQAKELLGHASTSGAAGIQSLILAQMLYDRSDLGAAASALSDISKKDIKDLSGAQSPFLPVPWNALLQHPEPADLLSVKIAFATGEFKNAFEHCQKMLTGLPKDTWMSFLMKQSKLAMGNELNSRQEEINTNIAAVVAYDSAQQSLDAGEISLAHKWIDAIVNDKDPEWEGAIRTQTAAIRGELIEADVNAGDVNAASYSTGVWVKAEEIVKLRSLALAALARWQWNDALTLAGNLYHSCPDNKSNAALFLKVIVTTLENAESSRELGIKVHAPSGQNLALAKQELGEVQTALESCNLSEARRWSLRGKLVFEPTAANIRVLAMIPPQPGDITAMMGALHAMGDDTTATQVAKKFEGHPQVMVKLAQCLESSDKPAALTTISRALQIIEAQPDAWVARSMLEEQLGEKENAIQSMENALSYWPEETGWHIRAAKLWQSAGDVKKAVAHLNTASGQEKENTDLQFQIGSSYLSLGQSNEAIQILESASSREMNRSDILETLADAYYKVGNVEKALKTAEFASVANPFTVKPLLLTGEIALEKGEIAKALDYARQAISRNEKNADAITFLAKVLLKKGDKTQALAALEKAAASDEATLDLMLKHAHLVREIKGAADSRSIFEGLVKKYPQNTELHHLLAEAQLECGDKVAAEETARQSLRIDGNQPDLHGFLGKLKLENGNLDQAIHHFTEQISLDKEQMNGYLNLAKVYQQQREFHKALDTLQQAIDADPQDTRAFLSAAGLLKDAKDYASAEVMLRKAAAIDPKDINIKRQLGAVIALNLVHKSQQESSKL